MSKSLTSYYSFHTLFQLNHQFSLYSFIYSTQYISLSPLFHRLQNSCITLAIIQCFATISNPSQSVCSSPILSNKITIPLNHTNLQISMQHLPITMRNNHIFHQAKLLSLIKIFQWAQRCTQLKHVILSKTGEAESSRCIMQGPLSSRQNAEPCPKA